MTSDPDGGNLQFDTVVPDGPATAGVTCAGCGGTIADEYFDANGTTVCRRCRGGLVDFGETPVGWRPLLRAALFGVAAAVAGAFLYYAVIAITNFEIGIVAIAIGYMVGYAIKRALAGRGGRRFQVLALVLTYWAVGLAYTPMVFSAIRKQDESAKGGSSAAVAPAGSTGSLPLTIGAIVGFAFALPVLSVISSLPGGAISALIIAFGMHQAWKMTATPALNLSGPYRIGSGPPAPVPAT